jgi:uncharacterized protein (DUF3084 family)
VSDLGQLQDSVEKLACSNRVLVDQVASLQDERRQLNRENVELACDNKRLDAENARLARQLLEMTRTDHEGDEL